MSNAPLMPKATAVWLVDNTGLTFRQIADFCHLHELEVKGIADGEVAMGIKGMDPVNAGQLTREELEKGEKDSKHTLKLAAPNAGIPIAKPRKGPRYTPVSRRQDRPDAIAWLLRHHPELPDSQIMKLVGTTKPTIQAIRDRSHWNSSAIKPVDPVTLGLCSQLDLDFAVQKAAKKLAKTNPQPELVENTLLPASETTAEEPSLTPDQTSRESADETELSTVFEPSAAPVEEVQEEQYDADSVFAKLKALKETAPEEPTSDEETPSEPAKD